MSVVMQFPKNMSVSLHRCVKLLVPSRCLRIPGDVPFLIPDLSHLLFSFFFDYWRREEFIYFINLFKEPIFGFIVSIFFPFIYLCSYLYCFHTSLGLSGSAFASFWRWGFTGNIFLQRRRVSPLGTKYAASRVLFGSDTICWSRHQIPQARCLVP